MKILLIIEFKACSLELSENKTDNNFGFSTFKILFCQILEQLGQLVPFDNKLRFSPDVIFNPSSN